MPRPRTRTAPTAPCFATRACAVAQPYIERSGPVAWKIPRKTPPETHCHGRGVCAQALAGQGFGYSTGRSSRPREDLCVPISALLSDRKSTRLNSSHVSISYAVFCLKKKKQI